MHLSRGYPWKLELSERELTVIEKCLANEPLSDDEDVIADNLLKNITTHHAAKTSKTHRGILCSEPGVD